MDHFARAFTLGIDLGDKFSSVCVIDRKSGEVTKMQLSTTKSALSRALKSYQPARSVIEVGTHSPWVSRLLKELGHEVVVANPRRLGLIFGDSNKSDQADCEKLATLGDASVDLLSPVEHRSEKLQTDLATLRARDCLVAARTKLINCVRGMVKSCGSRLPKCSSRSFAAGAAEKLPPALAPHLGPMLESIQLLTRQIAIYDKQVLELNDKYLATKRIRQIRGVGPVTALAFVLTIGDPTRFKRSRDVGAYIGLVRRRSQSGGRDPELGITKTGDRMLRRYVVQSAQYMLGPFGGECDLRTWGLALAARGKKNAKKRAVVAVARKLSVLMHQLWVSGTPYEPQRKPVARPSGSMISTAGSTPPAEEGGAKKRVG